MMMNLFLYIHYQVAAAQFQPCNIRISCTTFFVGCTLCLVLCTHAIAYHHPILHLPLIICFALINWVTFTSHSWISGMSFVLHNYIIYIVTYFSNSELPFVKNLVLRNILKQFMYTSTIQIFMTSLSLFIFSIYTQHRLQYYLWRVSTVS